MLSEPAIEIIAQMICGAHGNTGGFEWENFPYRSSYYITQFFKGRGLPYEHNGSTRITWVTNVLNEINTRNERDPGMPSLSMQKVIVGLIDSVRFKKPNNYIGALNDINNTLMIIDGLTVQQQGGKHVLVKIDEDQSISIPEVQPSTNSRIHIDDIDSFHLVKTVSPGDVLALLTPNGYLDVNEDFIQTALEDILAVHGHKKDWGGEINDLYTANLTLHGKRTASAFLLKGNGLRSNTLEISNCGKNGDQIVRLFDSPAELFIVQFVGQISENVIRDVHSKVNEKRLAGHSAYYCIINGQDTARLLKAYRKI